MFNWRGNELLPEGEDFIGVYVAMPQFDGCQLFLCWGPNLHPKSRHNARGFYWPGQVGIGPFEYPMKPTFFAADVAIRQTNFLQSALEFYEGQPVLYNCCNEEDDESKAKADVEVMKSA
ncbi:hypothetical protein FOA52_005574 [Chlamydomonas sp. UWO 241]|nr:hypothetical protein FOA52_005574 [Chlamydomonas sp. UWO 241]